MSNPIGSEQGKHTYSNLTADELLLYLYKKRSRAKDSLTILSRYRHFIEAMETPVGQHLLIDALNRHDELLLRISAIDTTDAEKMEYRALKNILNKWSEKIANYYSELNKIKEATNVKPNS